MKSTVLLLSISLFTFMLVSIGTATIYGQSDDSYETIKIGTQVWMAQNLNVDKFRNGDLIPEAKTSEEWLKAAMDGQPVWSYYNNKTENGDKYGKLYNWFAVVDPRGLAPEGWIIPSFDDMTVLIEYADKNLADFFDNNVTGRILKSTDGWSDNGNGTNESKFTALPGGWRYMEGDFFNLTKSGYWWSSTNINRAEAWAIRLQNDGDHAIRIGKFKGNGLSIRCIKE